MTKSQSGRSRAIRPQWVLWGSWGIIVLAWVVLQTMGVAPRGRNGVLLMVLAVVLVLTVLAVLTMDPAARRGDDDG